MHAPKQHAAEPTEIEVAFAELSEGAFAVWIRLCIMPTLFRAGRAKLARELGYHPRTLDRRLRELRDRRYIRLVMHGDGKATDILLTRRAMIVGPSGFVKL